MTRNRCAQDFVALSRGAVRPRDERPAYLRDACGVTNGCKARSRRSWRPIMRLRPRRHNRPSK